MWACAATIKLNLACESMTMTMIRIEKQLSANANRIVLKNLDQLYVRVDSVHDMYRSYI